MRPKESDAPTVAAFTLGPFATNCYVVTPRGKHEECPCWIIDAGLDPQEMLKYIRGKKLRPSMVILTHAHIDHIAGLGDVRREFPDVPILIHEAERTWLGDPEANLSGAYGFPLTTPEATGTLKGGETLALDGDDWRVRHTPGHSPGGITLVHEASRVAIVGDTLFAGSVGRTDFSTSDHDALVRSIREQLYTLPDETVILPGHGEASTIGEERRTNPFVRG